MNKTLNIFLNLSGILFWLLALTLVLPIDMGFFGLVGVYMGMFAFPFVFIILIIFSFLLSIFLIIKKNQLNAKQLK